MDIKLRGAQYQELMKALLDAYRSPPPLERLLRLRLDKNLWEISLGPDLQSLVFAVIDDSQAKGWTARLIAAAYADRPDNDLVRSVAARYGLSAIPETRPALERLVARSSRFVDVAAFLGRGVEVEAQVCRIEAPVSGGKVVHGTGFLVGPSAVLTNYHVMEPVILGEQGKTTADGLAGKAANVTLRFDYKRTMDGREVQPGVVYKLVANDWLISASPPSAVDHLAEPDDRLPDAGELDYAVLRLAEPAGDHQVGHSGAPGAEQAGAPLRGWVLLPDAMPDIERDTTVLIMQHPEGQPLQLAIGSDAICGLNGNNTRIRYQTSTLGGSSGSPVFNIDWELIALHHLGDPNFNREAKFNQGIPAPAIWARLQAEGKLAALAEL
jgi:hypothetical protein